MLALIQDWDNFTLDYENQIVKPIQEDCFLGEISKYIEDISKQQELPLPRGLYQERLSDVKNKLLEGLKVRWMKSAFHQIQKG